jgi:hypothetical protein
MKKNLYLMLTFIVFSGCSKNFEKIYDCDGVEVILNDYDRLFVVDGFDLSNRDGFFMNQTTVFGKFYETADGSAVITFNKMNNTLEFTDPSQTLTATCIKK